MTRLTLVQGDTALLKFQVLNSDNSPVDLTLFDILFTIKRSNQDTDAEAIWQGLSAGVSPAIEKIAPQSNGYCDVTIPAVITKLLRMGRPVYWDIEVSVGDLIFTPLSGDILVYGETTNA